MMKRISSLLLALCLLLCPIALAEETPREVAIASYHRELLADWSPSFDLTIPGVLVNLSGSDGMLMITALEGEKATPTEYLSNELDQAGAALSVSSAQIASWKDPFDGNGACLTYAYTYPEGDEEYLCSMWVASRENLLIEVKADTWGEDAIAAMESARAAIDQCPIVSFYGNITELTAILTDIIDGTDGVQIQLTQPSEYLGGGSQFYPLATDAVILFPTPDDPTALYSVSPSAVELIDAMGVYEENSDAPAVFHATLSDGVVVYMEFSLTY